ncbi:MAG: VCBS repeat-containing protein [Bacteroidia bacterium]|nr:VCBS repeat-containing protein [Bacteroidia bacterium]
MRLFILSVISVCLSHLAFGQLSFDEEAAVMGLNTTCGTTYLGNGISFADYNNDGWDDITLTTATGVAVRFFKNTNGMFSEEFLNIPSTTFEQKQVNWVDIDNDGDKDLFVTSDTDGNRLYENDGSLNFQDITMSAGLPTTNMFTYGASWGDVNNDGYLDVYISNRDITFMHTNKLYLNNGNKTFSNITNSAGVGIAQLSFCSSFFDYNNDGYQDIYISNDKYYTQNYLFRNNGDNTFTDVSQQSQTDCSIDAMTTTIGDYNGDGWFDIYVTNGPEGNLLYRNNADGTFTDIAESSGTFFESLGWGAVFLDADNDMDLDLYVSGSLDGSIPGLISAAMYENIGVDSFTIPGNAGFDDDVGDSYSNAIGDVNNDGLPEIVVSNSSDQDLYLWSNKSSLSNNWLKIRLEGTDSNRDGIGSKIEISVNGTKQYRYTLCGEGYLSQNSNTEFFGLGTNTVVDYVKVNWLSGTEDIFYNVSANQVLDILEGSETLGLNDPLINDFKIFPNPVSDLLNVEADQAIQSVRIYNLLGQIVMTFEPNDHRSKLDVSSLNSGTYIVKIVSEDSQKTLKLVKN